MRSYIYESHTVLSEEERHQLGKRVLAARIKYHLSQKTIAAQMHCTTSHISITENGKYKWQETYDRVFAAIAEIVVLREEAERQRYLASIRQQMAMGASA